MSKQTRSRFPFQPLELFVSDIFVLRRNEIFPNLKSKQNYANILILCKDVRTAIHAILITTVVDVAKAHIHQSNAQRFCFQFSSCFSQKEIVAALISLSLPFSFTVIPSRCHSHLTFTATLFPYHLTCAATLISLSLPLSSHFAATLFRCLSHLTFSATPILFSQLLFTVVSLPLPLAVSLLLPLLYVVDHCHCLSRPIYSPSPHDLMAWRLVMAFKIFNFAISQLEHKNSKLWFF